jgi:hypothetical protein
MRLVKWEEELLSQNSLTSLSVSQSTVPDDYASSRTSTGLSPTASLPASQRDFGNHINSFANYHASGQISSNSSTVSVGEYLTAKEGSLLVSGKGHASQETGLI